MKKPLLSIEEPEPKKKAVRADRPPTEGFATIVDGHFKSEFDTAEAAEVSGRKLKTAYPMLQVQVYDAAMKVRTLLSYSNRGRYSRGASLSSPLAWRWSWRLPR